MGTIWVREFKGGLDTRRLPELTTGGLLLRADDGHITRGGEFEQRAAFVPEFTLPAGQTVGLFYTRAGIYVFGHVDDPGAMPTGVTYQQLEHPDDDTIALVRVRSADLYQGKIYAVGEFADGAIYHFYDGVEVEDWFDGRARATFTITGGGVNAAVAAEGSFDITGGTLGAGNEITTIAVGGVAIIGAPVAHTGDDATTATAVAAAINGYSSSPNYTAVAVGNTVTITAAIAGTAANGRVVVPTPGGDATVGNIANMSGGAASTTSTLSDLTIDGVSIISAPVLWDTDDEGTAVAIATAINSFTSTPDYTASAAGASVSIAAVDPGPTPNGYDVVATVANGLVLDPASGLEMANGADSLNTYQPGTFVRTIGQKMYSVSGPNMHFSGVAQPTRWTTDVAGAGFVDMSSESSGSEELVALARYQNFVAIFSERVIQIWAVDPDPALNAQRQVLNNTGTGSPGSVTPFGDVDIFYLDESGLRSLRARDSSNAAASNDIGIPVDSLITAALLNLNENERQQVIGLIEPSSGRFWLIMREEIFVYSAFPGSQINAWSRYLTTYINGSTTTEFSVDAAIVYNRRVYLRSGDTIFVYGGLAGGDEYDATEAVAYLPYLDANDPTRRKHFNGIDVASRGQWRVGLAADPNNEDAEDLIATVTRTTYANDGRISLNMGATHVSPRFRSVGTGPHTLGACVLHYKGDRDEDGG